MMRSGSGNRRRFFGDRRGSVSLELALVSVLFLVPLLIFTTDGFFVFAAKTQTESALHSLFFYGWSNPGDATNLTALQEILTEINKHSTITIGFPANFQPQTSYACLDTSSGATQTAQVTTSSNGTTTVTCPSGTDKETLVDYKLTATVPLTLPFPGVPNPMTIDVGGTVRVQ